MSRTRLTYMWNRTCCLCTDMTSKTTTFRIKDRTWHMIARNTGMMMTSDLPLQVCGSCYEQLLQPSTVEFRFKCMDAKELLKLFKAVRIHKKRKAGWPRELPDVIIQSFIEEIAPNLKQGKNWRESLLMSSPKQLAAMDESAIDVKCRWVDGLEDKGQVRSLSPDTVSEQFLQASCRFPASCSVLVEDLHVDVEVSEDTYEGFQLFIPADQLPVEDSNVPHGNTEATDVTIGETEATLNDVNEILGLDTLITGNLEEQIHEVKEENGSLKQESSLREITFDNFIQVINDPSPDGTDSFQGLLGLMRHQEEVTDFKVDYIKQEGTPLMDQFYITVKNIPCTAHLCDKCAKCEEALTAFKNVQVTSQDDECTSNNTVLHDNSAVQGFDSLSQSEIVAKITNGFSLSAGLHPAGNMWNVNSNLSDIARTQAILDAFEVMNDDSVIQTDANNNAAGIGSEPDKVHANTCSYKTSDVMFFDYTNLEKYEHLTQSSPSEESFSETKTNDISLENLDSTNLQNTQQEEFLCDTERLPEEPIIYMEISSDSSECSLQIDEKSELSNTSDSSSSKMEHIHGDYPFPALDTLAFEAFFFKEPNINDEDKTPIVNIVTPPVHELENTSENNSEARADKHCETFHSSFMSRPTSSFSSHSLGTNSRDIQSRKFEMFTLGDAKHSVVKEIETPLTCSLKEKSSRLTRSCKSKTDSKPKFQDERKSVKHVISKRVVFKENVKSVTKNTYSKKVVSKKNKRGSSHKHAASDNPNHECQVCQKSYSRLHYLENHLLRDECHGFKCHQCPKTYTCLAHLRRHQLNHAGKREYICDHCSKSYNRRDQLCVHMLSHAEHAPYRCTLCARRFNRSDQFKLHLRRHTGEKPYACDTCGMRFCQKSDKNRHAKLCVKTAVTKLRRFRAGKKSVLLLDNTQ